MKTQTRTLVEKLQWLKAWLTGAEDRASRARAVAEPPLTPFDLDALKAIPAARAAADRLAQEQAATLVELGVPSELAQRFEVAFKTMGHTHQGRVVGFRYRTPDGETYAVKLGEAA
jgi:hypothetical protein